MRFLIQKVNKASVEIDGKIYSQISDGILVLIGIKEDDTSKQIEYMVQKVLNMRLFSDNDKYFEKSVMELNKDVLLVSQFTLYAKCNKGRRPDFISAAKPDKAKILYEEIVSKFKETGLNIRTGVFGAKMNVNIENNGPITIMLDSDDK